MFTTEGGGVERQRSIPDWEGTLVGLTEALDDVLFSIQMGRETGVRADILALEAFDLLDRFLVATKLDLGL